MESGGGRTTKRGRIGRKECVIENIVRVRERER